MPKYSPDLSVKLSLPLSPSLLYNNLSTGGGSLAYCHLGEAVTVFESKVGEAAKLQAATGAETHILSENSSSSRHIRCRDVDTVFQIKVCSFEDAYIVLSTGSSIQVWDRTGSRMLFSFMLPQQGANSASFDGSGSGRACVARGITSVMAADDTRQICVGSFSGAIFVFELKEGKFRHANTLRGHLSPITDLGSEFDSSRGTKPSAARHMISGDHDGCITVWDAASSGRYTAKIQIPGDGIPCVGVRARGQCLVCASACGIIKIYNLKSEKLWMEICGHSRWLSALDMHPSLDIFATVSEDSTLNTWTLPADGTKVQCILSAVWPNTMLTGVTFCGPGARCIAVTAYDRPELCIWPDIGHGSA